MRIVEVRVWDRESAQDCCQTQEASLALILQQIPHPLQQPTNPHGRERPRYSNEAD